MASRIVAFGELLLRLSPPGFERIEQASSFDVEYGGSEANVCVSLARMDHSVSFVTRLPENELGKTALDSMRRFGINTNAICYGGDRMGIYFLENGAVSRPSKVIYDRSYSSMTQIMKGMINWDEVFMNCNWFHWSGITPALSQNAAEVVEEALKAASVKNIFISADINYRNNLWNYGKNPYEVMPHLISYCDLLLGGNDDSLKVLGINVPVREEEISVEEEASSIEARSVLWKQHFPKLKVVASTIRRSYSASHNLLGGALYDGNELFLNKGIEITHIVDRVGGGDAFMAGIIHGMLTYKNDFQKTVDFAVAASALKHTIKGDLNLVSAEEVEKLMKQGKSIRIVR